MNFGINKPKIFDVQTTSFAEILLVILFFLLIFNIDSVEKVTGKEKQITLLTEENLNLKKIIIQKDKDIKELEKDVLAWKRKFIFVNKENIDLRRENKRIKLEMAKVIEEVDKTKQELDKYKNKYGKLDGDDVVNFCRLGDNKVFPVLNVIANKRKFIITPLWNKKKYSQYIKKIPGLNRVNNKLIINHRDFGKYFGSTYRWGDRQKIKCRFIINLYTDKSIKNAKTIKYIYKEVDRHFYKRGS